MKLHLPKGLLAAVMAACMGSWHASAMQTEAVYHSFLTSETYESENYSYENGTLTLKKNPNTLSLTFTLDYDQFTGVTGSSADLLYVNTTGSIWGLRATTTDTVTGRWQNGDYATDATTMDATALESYVTGTGENQVIEGLQATLESGGVGTKLLASDGKSVFNCSGLTQGSKTFSSAWINTNLITEITVDDVLTDRLRYVNAAGTWKKVFENDKVTNVTNGRLVLEGGENKSAALNTNPLVVGGSGQLHLEAYRKGDVLLDDDIYLGSSSYNESGYHNAADYGVIRISNDDNENEYETTLSGKIYLVEDSSIKGTGVQPIYITGTVTDKGVPTGEADATEDGDYTLTIGGAGIDISATVNVGGLSFEQGKDSNGDNFAGVATISSASATVDRLSVGTNTTLSISNNLTVGSTVMNAGTIKLNGANVTFDNLDSFHYDVVDETYYNTTGEGKSAAANGYLDYNKLLLIKGNVTTEGTNNLTGNGLNSWTYESGDGIVGTLEASTFDETRFYINSGTVRLSKTDASSDGVVYSDNTAGIYVVAGGAALDAYFNTNNFSGDYALVGKTIELHDNAKLTNTGGDASDSWQQLKHIELKGNATLEATSGNSYGFLASNYGESILNLNSYTLEKTGDGEFCLLNTTVSNGVINITGGQLVIQSNVGKFASGTNFNNATITVGDAGTLEIQSMKNAAALSNLLCSTSGSGTIKLKVGNSTEVAITGTSFGGFTGTVDLTTGQLYVGQSNNGDKPGAVATVNAEKIIVRNGAALWTHLGGDDRTLSSDIDLLSGSALRNRDGSSTLSGDIRFNIKDPSAETPEYDSAGSVALSTHWEKTLTLTGLISGDGQVNITTPTKDEQNTPASTWKLTNDGNTFQGSYNLAGRTKLVLAAENAARNATINLNGDASTVATLELAQNATIKSLNSEDADSVVTTTAEATLTVSEGSFAGILQDGPSTNKLSLKKTGTGKLTLSGANAYTGGTEIRGGTLALNGAGLLGTGEVSIKASTLELQYGVSLNVDSIKMSEDAVINMRNGDSGTLRADITIDGSGTLKAGEYGSNTKVEGSIGGSGSLKLQQGDYGDTWTVNSAIGDGLSVEANANVSLTSENTYTGGTTISGRTLTTDNASALGTGKVSLEGGILKLAAALSVSAMDYVSVSESSQVQLQTNDLEVTGTLSVGENVGMRITGAGTTTVNTLQLNAGASISTEGALSMTNLSMGKDSSMAANETINLNNGTLTLGSGIKLTGSLLTKDALDALGTGEKLEIFSGITQLNFMQTDGVTRSSSVTVAYTGPVDITHVFSVEGVEEGMYELTFSGDSLWASQMNIPEPATATLSLLALAGLCARRRRKS